MANANRQIKIIFFIQFFLSFINHKIKKLIIMPFDKISRKADHIPKLIQAAAMHPKD
jgi:hypothetical protein